MTRKTAVTYLLFLITLMTAPASAVQSPTATAVRWSTAPKPAVMQWEYLVVSFGKAYFSEPMNSADKQAGLSKIRAFSQAGMITAQEATHIQYNMDKLGKFGWELVGVIGVIGGDQELIFKRPYDADRSLKEATLIMEEGKRLAEAEKEMEAQRAAEAGKQSGEELVDLDEAERKAHHIESRNTAERLLEQAVYKVVSRPLVQSMRIVCKEESWPPSGRVDVTLDGTTQLLKDGNKYRNSEATAFAAKFVEDFVKAAGLEPDLLFANDINIVQIDTNVAISYGGKSRIVYTQYDRRYWLKN